MFEDKKKLRQAAKWMISVITICIVIFLGMRHIDHVAGAVMWLVNLFKPLLLGVVLALFLNVPVSTIEKQLFRNTKNPRKRKARRPLAILLGIILVLGIFAGVAFLVVPELIEAVKLLGQIAVTFLDTLVQMEENSDLSEMPYGEYLSQINIDWLGLKKQLEQWISNQSGIIVDQVMVALGSIASGLVTFLIGLVFSIYSLVRKELLKYQVCRLIRIWFPKRFGDAVIHISSVCNTTLRDFIVGQATEAVILGSLCIIGMAILRIPYAPMIGALVGVTALIPYVGAWIAALIGSLMILTVNPFKAFVFIVFLLALQQVEGNVIYPKVVGAKIKLPAMWVLAAITVGGNLAGPIGMLLGVPAASAMYALLKEATNEREKRMADTEK